MFYSNLSLIGWSETIPIISQSFDLTFTTRDNLKFRLIKVLLRQIKDFTRHLTGHFTSLVLNTRRLLEWLADILSIGSSLTGNNSVHSPTDLPV